jgi:hypothetical protein
MAQIFEDVRNGLKTRSNYGKPMAHQGWWVRCEVKKLIVGEYVKVPSVMKPGTFGLRVHTQKPR